MQGVGLTDLVPAGWDVLGMTEGAALGAHARGGRGHCRLEQKGSGGMGRGRTTALSPWKGNRNVDATKTVVTLVYSSVLIS